MNVNNQVYPRPPPGWNYRPPNHFNAQQPRNVYLPPPNQPPLPYPQQQMYPLPRQQFYPRPYPPYYPHPAQWNGQQYVRMPPWNVIPPNYPSPMHPQGWQNQHPQLAYPADVQPKAAVAVTAQPNEAVTNASAESAKEEGKVMISTGVADESKLEDSLNSSVTSDLGRSLNTSSEFDKSISEITGSEIDLKEKSQNVEKNGTGLKNVDLEDFTKIGKELQIMKSKFETATNESIKLKPKSTMESIDLRIDGLNKKQISLNETSKQTKRKVEVSIDLTVESDDSDDPSDETNGIPDVTNEKPTNVKAIPQNASIELHNLPGITLRKVSDADLSNDIDKNARTEKTINSSEISEWIEDISNLPKGWKIKQLGNLGRYIKGTVMSPEGKIFPSMDEAKKFIFSKSESVQKLSTENETDWKADEDCLPPGWKKKEPRSTNSNGILNPLYKTPSNKILKSGSEVIAYMRTSKTCSMMDVKKFMLSRKRSRQQSKGQPFSDKQTEMNKRRKVESEPVIQTKNNQDINNKKKMEELQEKQEIHISPEQDTLISPEQETAKNRPIQVYTDKTHDYQQPHDIEKISKDNGDFYSGTIDNDYNQPCESEEIYTEERIKQNEEFETGSDLPHEQGDSDEKECVQTNEINNALQIESTSPSQNDDKREYKADEYLLVEETIDNNLEITTQARAADNNLNEENFISEYQMENIPVVIAEFKENDFQQSEDDSMIVENVNLNVGDDHYKSMPDVECTSKSASASTENEIEDVSNPEEILTENASESPELLEPMDTENAHDNINYDLENVVTELDTFQYTNCETTSPKNDSMVTEIEYEEYEDLSDDDIIIENEVEKNQFIKSQTTEWETIPIQYEDVSDDDIEVGTEKEIEENEFTESLSTEDKTISTNQYEDRSDDIKVRTKNEDLNIDDYNKHENGFKQNVTENEVTNGDDIKVRTENEYLNIDDYNKHGNGFKQNEVTNGDDIKVVTENDLDENVAIEFEMVIGNEGINNQPYKIMTENALEINEYSEHETMLCENKYEDLINDYSENELKNSEPIENGVEVAENKSEHIETVSEDLPETIEYETMVGENEFEEGSEDDIKALTENLSEVIQPTREDVMNDYTENELGSTELLENQVEVVENKSEHVSETETVCEYLLETIEYGTTVGENEFEEGSSDDIQALTENESEMIQLSSEIVLSEHNYDNISDHINTESIGMIEYNTITTDDEYGDINSDNEMLLERPEIMEYIEMESDKSESELATGKKHVEIVYDQSEMIQSASDIVLAENKYDGISNHINTESEDLSESIGMIEYNTITTDDEYGDINNDNEMLLESPEIIEYTEMESDINESELATGNKRVDISESTEIIEYGAIESENNESIPYESLVTDGENGNESRGNNQIVAENVRSNDDANIANNTECIRTDFKVSETQSENSDQVLNETEPEQIGVEIKDILKTIGPPTSVQFSNFAKLCLVFINSPTPPKSTTNQMCSETSMSAKDIKWIFIKLRQNFQPKKGAAVDENAVFDVLNLIRSTKLNEDVSDCWLQL